MSADEVRQTLADAKRVHASACAPAGQPAGTICASAEVLDTLAKVIEAAESLLSEYDAFSGRLRRTAIIPPARKPDDPLPKSDSLFQ